MDSTIVQSLTSLAIWTLAAGMAFLLGRSTAPGAAYSLALSPRFHAQAALSPAGVVGSPIQRELLAAARAAANEDGALILAVRLSMKPHTRELSETPEDESIPRDS